MNQLIQRNTSMKSKSLMLGVAMGLAGMVAAGNAAAPQPPAWVAESNQDAQIVLKTLAQLSPESAQQLGVDGLDDQATTLPIDVVQQTDAAVDADVAQLNALLAKATDPHLK